MRAAFLIAGKDLRQRLRDRSAIVLGIVAPLAIAALMSVTFRGAANFHVTVAVVDRDHGPVAASLVRVLRSRDLHDILTVQDEPNVGAAAHAVRSRDAGAGIVIPAGFSRAAAGTAAAHVDVLTSVDETLSGRVVRAITGGFTTQVDADRLSVATALAAGAPTDNAAALAAKAANLQIPVAATLQPVGARPLEIISYYAPAMAMFFVFFGVPFGARSFFTERREGTLDRIVAAPVPAAAVLLGKALSVFAYALVSLLTVAVVTSLAFGARWGGPLPVVILCVAISTAVVALTAFVIGVSRTDRQAEGFAAIVVFGLALLGGNFIFMSTAPPFLRRLALATPNGWALRGFTDLATGLGAHAVVEPVVAILVFSFVVGGIAALFAPRAVAR